MKPVFLTCLAALALSACVKYAEVTTPPQPVTFTDKRAQTASKGYTDVTVRAFQSTEKGRKDNQELSGAKCMVRGTGFHASLSTPAILKMPVYHGAADPITVSCSTGKDKKSQTVKPINMTLLRLNQTTSSGGGLLGVAITAAAKGIAKAARDPLKDEFNYPVNIFVTLGVPD